MNKQHERLLPFLVFSFSFVLLFAYSATSIQAASPQSVTTSITGNTVTGNVSTQIVPPQVGGKIYGIQGGQTVGKNLFHSFGQFNVGAGDTAQFQTSNLTQNAAISNILGRINGQQSASQIFGTIDSATFYPSANLFLMNPYGFLFGPNASVNVGGMVAFTSADYLRLEGAGGNGTFYADAAKGSILTSSPVAAFGFLGSNPGAITVQGSQLSVTPGQSLSLVGGNITVQSGTLDNGTVQTARLSAPGGQINVAGVASPGELSAVDFAPLSSMTMGNISLSQGATLETSANTAGPIVIRGGQLMMDDASIKAISMDGLGGGNDAPNISPKISITAETVSLANGALITADSYGTAAAGDITLNVDTLTTQAGVNRLPLNPPPLDFNFAGNFIASDSRSTDAGAGPAGNITIQGVGGSGTAATSVLLKDSTISSRIFGGTPTTRPSAITITADSVVLTNAGLPAGGDAATIVANTLGTAPGGHVAFNVNTLRSNVNADETPIAGAQKVYVISNNDPGSTAGPTGTITISGIRLESTDAAQLVALNNTNVSTGVDGGNPRTAPGNITITTDTLSLINDTQIFTASFGDGGSPAGNIFFNVNTLRANTRPDGTLITGVPRVLILSVSLVSGQAGNITISGIQPQTTDAARQLALNNIELNTVVFGSTPQTAPAALTLTAENIHLTQSTKFVTDTQGGAPAGNIMVTANTLLADDGSQISSSSSAAGPGGNISITAEQSVTLNSGSLISASSTGPGNAGNILINANKVMISGSATITASSKGAGNAGTVTIQGLNSPANSFLIDGAGSGVFTNTEDTGAGGSISINANAVTLQNGGTVSASTSGTTSAATGGNVSISAGQFIQMNDGAAITASSTGPGNAGNIFIDAGPQLVMQNSSIKTEAAHSGGGDIEIQAVDLVQLGNSTVSTSVLGGTGSGGNITIDPNIVLLQNSQIIAQAVQGTGGNISITTNLLLPDSSSIISASSQFGQQGTISIQSPIAPASGKIIPLSQKPLIEAALVSQRCAALAGGNASTFTVAGRDSLPAEPGGWLSSPLALATADNDGRPSNQLDLSEPTRPILSLRRIAPPGFLTQSFGRDTSSDCTS